MSLNPAEPVPSPANPPAASGDARQLVAQGRPAEALARVQADVRGDPSNAKHRVFLFQLLCLSGQWERAMTQLNVLADIDPGATLLVRAGAAAIQCEVFRAGVFKGERDPVVFGEPADWVGWLVHANRLLAAGEPAAADELRDRALAAAPAVAGTIDGKPFAWLADADGRLGPLLEAIIDGRYYWVPFHQVRSITIEPPADLRDLVWSPARFTWANGGEAVGLIPTRYVGSEDPADPAACMARKTDWSTAGSAQVGRGQRLFATDQDDYAILETRSIKFDQPELPDPPAGTSDVAPDDAAATPGGSSVEVTPVARAGGHA